MKHLKLLLLTVAIFTTSCGQPSAAPTDPSTSSGQKDLKALIVDGQNNHAVWPKSTLMMRQYLLDTGIFTQVDVARTKYLYKGEAHEALLPLANSGVEGVFDKQPKTDPDFAPEFSKYDLVVSNFGHNAASWPAATMKSFEDYVAGGGGFVSVHAADNSFPLWTEYNKMIGLGGWGGRTEKSGP